MSRLVSRPVVHEVQTFLLETLPAQDRRGPLVVHACIKCYRKWRWQEVPMAGGYFDVIAEGDGACEREQAK